MASLAQAFQDLSKTIESLELENKKNESLILENKKIEEEATRKRLNDFESQQSALETRISKLERENELLKESVVKKNDDLNQWFQLIKILTNQVASLQEFRDNVTHSVHELERDVKRQQNSLESLDSQVKSQSPSPYFNRRPAAPRYRPQYNSIPVSEIEDMADDAEKLMQTTRSLSEQFKRSFDGGSLYSNE